MGTQIQEYRPNQARLLDTGSERHAILAGIMAAFLCLTTMLPSTLHRHIDAPTWVVGFEALNLLFLAIVFLRYWLSNRKEHDQNIRFWNMRVASMAAGASALVSFGFRLFVLQR